MPTKKILENQKKTAKRLEKEAELARHQEGLDKLEQIRTTQLETTRILINFLNGKTTKTEITNQLKEIGTPDAKKVVAAVEKLIKKVDEKTVDLSPMTALLEKVVAELEKKPNELPGAPEQVEVDFTSTNGKLDELIAAFKDSAKEIVVKAPDVKVAAAKAPIVKVEKLDVTSLVQPLVDAVAAIREYNAPEFIPTDLTTVEELLTAANKLLEKIEKKKFGGGGGGGGGMVPFTDPVTGLSIQVPTEVDHSLPVTIKNPGDISSGATGISTYTYIQKDTTSDLVNYKYYGYMDKDSNWCVKRVSRTTNLAEFAVSTVQSPALSPNTYDNAWTNRATIDYVSYGGAF